MEWLPTSILPREARFAYVASAFRLAEIYVPFVDGTDARNAQFVQQSEQDGLRRRATGRLTPSA
jgi:hypothetical protein